MIAFIIGVIIGGALGMLLMGILCDGGEKPLKLDCEEEDDDRRRT